jgi:hypothetical protein
MNYEQHAHARYHDLLGDHADPELVRLVVQLDHDLGTVYRLDDPPQHLVAAIDRAVQQRTLKRRQPLGRQGPFLFAPWLPHRLSMGVTLLVVIVCLVAAGYAMAPILQQAFHSHTGTGAILSRNLGKPIDASRTIEGFTVAVKHVYADANQIVIGYTITGPRGRTFNNIMAWGDYDPGPGHPVARSPFLTDTRGNALNGGLGGEQPGIQDGTVAQLLSYDGVGIGSNATEIQVRLTIGKLSAYERLGENRFRDVTVNGPFEFDLTIPVERGRVADLHQVVEVGGTPATLERVVTTPTGTRVSLRGVGPNAEAQLTVDGVTYKLQPPDGLALPTRWSTDSQWEYITGTSLQDKHGTWLLVVKPGLPVPAHVDPAGTRVTGGPWTFHFVVP